MQYTIVKHEGEEYVTAFIPGRLPLAASTGHPNFDRIKAGVLAGDESVADLFDIAETVSRRFERLSERVTVRDGHVYLDGDEINNALTKQILRFLDEDEDFEPLVNFFEKVQANPKDHSREQLFKFLDKNGMVISLAEDGDIVAYKGMRRKEDENGEVFYQPTSHGHVIIDGVDFARSDDAEACQYEGSVVEMPRSEVVHDPHQTCSVGLHIATYDYASTYGNVIVEVRVNPRDVVSVPNDSSQKVRACRYRIVGEVQGRYETAVVREVPQPDDDEAERIEDYAATNLSGEPAVAEPREEGDPVVEQIVEKLYGDDTHDPDAETNSTEGNGSDEDSEVDLVQPDDEEFRVMTELAKRQKKGIKAVAPTRGWILVGDSPKEAASWRKRA